MGLREAKKQRLRRELMNAAVESIRARGFEATRVRDVCQRCEVSEATFFNYFSGKDALCAEWIEHFLAERAAAVENRSRGRGSRARIRELADELTAAVAADAAFLKEVWGRARGAPGALESVARMLLDGQQAGELRRDVQAEELADVVVATVRATLARWLERSDEPSPGPRLRRALDLLLDGARRRHERVRAPAQRFA